jgi:hypothetical protein
MLDFPNLATQWQRVEHFEDPLDAGYELTAFKE